MIRSNFARSAAALGAICSLANAGAALAENSGQPLSPEKSLEAIDESFTTTSTTSDGGRLRPSARIVGGTTDTSVQITISTHSESRSLPSNSDFSLTFTAPLDEDTGRGDFLTVDGLPSQWSVGGKLSFSFLDFNGINQRIGSRSGYLQKAKQNCLVAEQNARLSEEERASKCDLMESQVGDYLNEDDLNALNNDRQAVLDDLEKRPFALVNLSANVGTQEFSFYESNTLAESKLRKYSWSGGVWVGYLPKLRSKLFLVGGFEAKKSYKDAKKATYCPTGAVTPTVKCTTGPFGPPEEEIDYKFALKARYQIGGGVGLELAGAYDAHDDSWGIELPVYFIMDKDGGLTGGIRAAYDSKEKDVQFGIFVGKTFGFLKL